MPLLEISRRREEFRSAKVRKPKHKQSMKILPNGHDNTFEVDNGVVLVRRVGHQATYIFYSYPRKVLSDFYNNPTTASIFCKARNNLISQQHITLLQFHEQPHYHI